jgi:hypothetical protein
MSAQAVLQGLRNHIAAGKITFQDPRFEAMLLGEGAGVKSTEKLRFLVLKLSELASPIEISSYHIGLVNLTVSICRPHPETIII